MFENPRRSRQPRNFTTNVPKILDLKSSSEQIFCRKLSLGAPDFLSDVFVVVAVVAGQAPYLAWPMVPLRETVTDKNTWIANDAVGQEIKNKEMTSFK